MGAFNYGIFDDDTAYDFFDEIKNDAASFFKESFNKALNDKYLEFDDCHAVTVSAAYLDNHLNETIYRTDTEDEKDESNVNNFGELHKELELKHLKPIAIKALEKVISKNSELNDLWSQNKELYPKWKQNIKELINRLK